MHGNVMEWCADGYNSGFYRRPLAAGPDPVSPPPDPAPGWINWVFRGGDFMFPADRCRSASREGFAPGPDGCLYIGVRPAISLADATLWEEFLRGDCNGDGTVNISDATCALDWLFGGEAAVGRDVIAITDIQRPGCPESKAGTSHAGLGPWRRKPGATVNVYS